MISWWLALSVAAAAEPMPDWTMKPDDVTRHLQEACFPSGLRVTLRVDDRQPVIAVTTVIGRGAADDPAGKAGASHVLEHAWFRARPGGGARVDERLVTIGAEYDARTLSDATIFVTEAPRSELAAVLKLEAERLLDPLAGVDARVVEQERTIVRAELARTGDLDLAKAPAWMPEAFFPAGIGADGGGESPASLAAVGLDDLRALARAWRPGVTSVYISGSFDPKAATVLVQDVFPDALVAVAADGSRPTEGHCEAGRRTPLLAPVHRDAPVPITAQHAPVDRNWLVFGWPLPPAYGPDEAKMRLAAWRTSLHLAGTLVGGSVERRERFQPRCELVPGVGASALLCAVQLPPKTSPQALLDEALEAIGTDTLGAEAEGYLFLRERALDVVDLQLAIGELSSLRGEHALADALSNHYTGSPMWFLEAAGAFNLLEAKDIPAFTGAWTKPGDVVARVLVPPGADPAAVLATQGAVDMWGRGGEAPLVETRRSTAALPLHHDPRSIALGDPPRQLDRPRLAEFATRTLPNGLQIVAVRRGTVPTVELAAVSRGGRFAESRRGLAAWAWDQLMFDSSSLPTGRSYTDTAVKIGGHWWMDDLPWGQTIGIAGTVGNLDGLLWILRHAVEHLKPHPTLDMRRENRFTAEDAVRRQLADPDHQAEVDRIAHLLGKDHPLAQTPWQRVLAGGAASEKELKAYFDASWSPDRLTVVVLGGIDPGAAVELAARMFGDWKPSGLPVLPPAPIQEVRASQRATFTLVDPLRALATVEVACTPSPAREAVDDVGTGIVRLLSAQRLEQGGLGDVAPRAWRTSWADDVVLHVAAEVAPDDARRAATTVLDLLAELGTRGPDASTLAVVRSRLARQHVLGFVNDDWLVDELTRRGAGMPAWAVAHQDAILAVTAADVAAWAASCAGKEAVTLIGPRAAPGEPL